MDNPLKVLIPVALIMAVVTSCAPQLKYVKDANIPFQRPSYFFNPPTGEDWVYHEWEESGNFVLGFGKKYDSSISNTHTFIGRVTEVHSDAKFESPEEFLKFVKKAQEISNDPRRYDVLEHEITLDNKFGDYCVQYFGANKDYHAANRGNYEYLTIKIYGYYFIHPYFSNLMIDVSYSERGVETEIDANFKDEAKRFVDGMTLKKQ